MSTVRSSKIRWGTALLAVIVASQFRPGTVEAGPDDNQPVPTPAATAPSTAPSTATSIGPDAWGNLDFTGIPSGTRMGPNGTPFHPLASTRLDLNLAVLPNKELYIFSETEYWMQNRTTDPLTHQSQQASAREYDLNIGLAWQPFDHFEMRGAVFANNNVNRGITTSTPFGFNDGFDVEGRYYFGKADVYDDGRLSFVSIGYAPTKTLIGEDGLTYKPGFFARAYATYDLPFLGAYIFGDGKYMQNKAGASKILEVDAGVALRPFQSHKNIELRVGDDVSRDLQANVTRSFIYGSVRINFGSSTPAVKGSDDGKQAVEPAKAPDVWGNLQLPFVFSGTHMAPNGVGFKPLFSAQLDVNVDLLPNKELYIFADAQLWAQRSAPGVTNKAQGGFDFSKREYDLDYGLAWNVFERFELRGSVYALNNLNRGNSLTSSSGGEDGGKVELRRYFGDADIYDTGRLSFLSIGAAPGQMVGLNGQTFHSGAFARAYATYDLAAIRSYLYGDGRFTAQDGVTPRLLELDAGLAVRPFIDHPHFEVRLGDDVLKDVHASVVENIIYGSLRLNF